MTEKRIIRLIRHKIDRQWEVAGSYWEAQGALLDALGCPGGAAWEDGWQGGSRGKRYT